MFVSTLKRWVTSVVATVLTININVARNVHKLFYYVGDTKYCAKHCKTTRIQCYWCQWTPMVCSRTFVNANQWITLIPEPQVLCLRHFLPDHMTRLVSDSLCISMTVGIYIIFVSNSVSGNSFVWAQHIVWIY